MMCYIHCVTYIELCDLFRTVYELFIYSVYLNNHDIVSHILHEICPIFRELTNIIAIVFVKNDRFI